MIDLTPAEDLATKRASVIDEMISSISNREDRHYMVGLVAYYIEGTQYSATGLSVDASTTPDICRTEIGFACSAMFSPAMLEPRIVEANGTTKVNLDGTIREAVRVKLEVMMDDVWCVAEFIDGRQHNLFVDPQSLKSGLAQYWSTSH
jgi:hypothetical protein